MPQEIGATMAYVLWRLRHNTVNLIGIKRGKLVVIGLADAKKAKNRPASWVVKCICGNYETRTAKAICNAGNVGDACQDCHWTLLLKKTGLGKAIWKRKGNKNEGNRVACHRENIKKMTKPRPPYLLRETTRHGVVVWYFRRGDGPRTRIRGDYGSPEFIAAYQAAATGQATDAPEKGRDAPETLAWLIARYRQSAAWATLSMATRRQRENIFLHIIKSAGRFPFASISRADIAAGRDRRAETPAAANNYLKTMRALFRWALESDMIAVDPTIGVKAVKLAGEGFHVWTGEEIAAFEARWPIGTRERLALAVLLFTGLRRGDAARLGRQHIRKIVRKDATGNLIELIAFSIKTEKTGTAITIPVLPALQEIIDASPTGDLALIATRDGRPMTKESFGNWFRDACKAAGVPGSAHGLRKAGATIAAENGATEQELNAIFGWTGSKMASHYTRTANRARLAARAMGKMER